MAVYGSPMGESNGLVRALAVHRLECRLMVEAVEELF